jgi:acyl-CoA reductase-like NAD-dependent aldehyde dehydrogenase
MVTVTSHKNFVGGEWVEPVDAATMEVLNPATAATRSRATARISLCTRSRTTPRSST